MLRRSALSGDMAVRIEKAFDASMETLMLVQSAYDIAETRKRQHRIKVSRFLTPRRGQQKPPRGRASSARLQV